MLPRIMGAAVFSIGFIMLLIGLADLLRPDAFYFGTGERILIYIGGIVLVLLGYFMARRLPVVPAPPEELVSPVVETREGPPAEHF